MLPEVQIVKHDLAAGARRRHETSASASATSETQALCRIGKQYAVREDRSIAVPARCGVMRSSGPASSIHCFINGRFLNIAARLGNRGLDVFQMSGWRVSLFLVNGYFRFRARRIARSIILCGSW